VTYGWQCDQGSPTTCAGMPLSPAFSSALFDSGRVFYFFLSLL
jgi:hypothetical protein